MPLKDINGEATTTMRSAKRVTRSMSKSDGPESPEDTAGPSSGEKRRRGDSIESESVKCIERRSSRSSPSPSPYQNSPRASPLATPGTGGKRVKKRARALKPPPIPMDIYLLIFSYMVNDEDFDGVTHVCTKWHKLANQTSIWKNVKMTLKNGSINWLNFQRMKHGSKPEPKEEVFGQISKGTEGICSKVRCRSTGNILAVKRARVFPSGEGVAYYVLRELAVLQDMSHPHINELFHANLAFDKLHIFFPYVQRTLQDVLMDNNSSNSTDLPPLEQKTPLSHFQVKMLLHQLLDATAYCHRRGVYHRNLKPKHLLIDIPADGNLDHAQLKVADFALVRSSGLPIRTYTAKVVTLWYRAPEILMGVTEYSHAVDIWSVGCVFAEMVLGRPLFTGSSEIDQLFQLFSTLGTPKEENWPGFSKLPNYGFAFPNWSGKPIGRIVPTLNDAGRDLLQKLLCYNAAERVSAEGALGHTYFGGANTLTKADGSTEERSLVPAIEIVDTSNVPYGHHVFYLHRYLRDAENRYSPMSQYLTGDGKIQSDMLPVHRAMLVDWLVELVDVFDMHLRSAFLAVGHTDRFLSICSVEREELQLVAATCLHVASKCEDTAYISVNDLVTCADNLYTQPQLLQMEEKLLNTLKFGLAMPTVYDFLKIFQEMMDTLPPNSRWLAEYLAELSLQEYEFLSYKPSLVATCAISLALHCTEHDHWPDQLQQASQYEWSALEACMKDLQNVYLRSPSSVLAVIRQRYSKPERNNVAALIPPATYGMRW